MLTIRTNSSMSSGAPASASASTSSASSNRPSSWSDSPRSKPGLGFRAGHERGSGQLVDLGEVAGVAGQSGGPHEEVGIGGSACVEASGRDAQRVLAATVPVLLGALDLLEQQPASLERRHAIPHDLAVERVGQAHELAASIAAHADRARVVELLERSA